MGVTNWSVVLCHILEAIPGISRRSCQGGAALRSGQEDALARVYEAWHISIVRSFHVVFVWRWVTRVWMRVEVSDYLIPQRRRWRRFVVLWVVQIDLHQLGIILRNFVRLDQ